MRKMECTLLLLKRPNEILLAKKKKGFGAGNFNGVGGKIELNETPEEGMLRETMEEIFVTPTKYYKIGVIEYLENFKGERANVVVHTYLGTEWSGEPKESEEVKPEWFSLDKIPYDKMFSDDKYWLPLVLEGKRLNAFFDFDDDWNIVSYKIDEVKPE